MILGLAFAAFALLAVILWLVQRRGTRKIHPALAQFPRTVVAAHLAEELIENRNKATAFITVYSDMLQKLRSLDQAAPYETSGDFIHRHVPLSRSVYDLYLDHCAILGPALQKELAEFYKDVRSETLYDELTRDTPRAQALRRVESAIDKAEKTLAAVDPLIQTLKCE